MKRATLGFAVLALVLAGTWALDRSGLVQINRPSAPRFPVRGIDVSHHQGSVDWSRVASAGMHFAYIKATEGGDFEDPRFRFNWESAAAAGVARGAYHFFTFCTSGREQGEHFLRVVPPTPGVLAPAVDVEFLGNCRSWASLDAIRTELRAHLRLLEDAWGVEPILYVTPEAYERVLAGQFDGYSIWLRSVFTQPALAAYGGWLIWQFSETGRVSGVDGPVDLDVLRPGASLHQLAVSPASRASAGVTGSSPGSISP